MPPCSLLLFGAAPPRQVLPRVLGAGQAGCWVLGAGLQSLLLELERRSCSCCYPDRRTDGRPSAQRTDDAAADDDDDDDADAAAIQRCATAAARQSCSSATLVRQY